MMLTGRKTIWESQVFGGNQTFQIDHIKYLKSKDSTLLKEELAHHVREITISTLKPAHFESGFGKEQELRKLDSRKEIIEEIATILYWRNSCPHDYMCYVIKCRKTPPPNVEDVKTIPSRRSKKDANWP